MNSKSQENFWTDILIFDSRLIDKLFSLPLSTYYYSFRLKQKKKKEEKDTRIEEMSEEIKSLKVRTIMLTRLI